MEVLAVGGGCLKRPGVQIIWLERGASLRLPDAVKGRFGNRGEEIALKVAKFNEENDVQLLDNLGAHKGPSSPPPKTPPRNEPNRTLCEPSFDGEAKPVNVNSTAVPHQKITAEEFQNKELLVLKLACVELRQADRLRRPTVVKQAAGGCL